MKTVKIRQEEGRTGLNFDSIDSFIAFEVKLEGKVTFVAEEGSSIEESLSKAAARPDQDYDQILPALKGAALRTLKEEDFSIAQIVILRAIEGS